MAFRAPAAPVRSHIYEKIIWEMLRESAPESIAELVAAVKDRCARLRVPYHHHEIDDALAAMGDKVTRELRPPASRHVERAPDPPPLSRAEATAALAAIAAKVGALPPIKPMPRAVVLTPRQHDKRRALGIVMQAVKDQVAVCEAAEQPPPSPPDTIRNVDETPTRDDFHRRTNF